LTILLAAIIAVIDCHWSSDAAVLLLKFKKAVKKSVTDNAPAAASLLLDFLACNMRI